MMKLYKVNRLSLRHPALLVSSFPINIIIIITVVIIHAIEKYKKIETMMDFIFWRLVVVQSKSSCVFFSLTQSNIDQQVVCKRA